jgi:hypothetical protein
MMETATDENDNMSDIADEEENSNMDFNEDILEPDFLSPLSEQYQ